METNRVRPLSKLTKEFVAAREKESIERGGAVIDQHWFKKRLDLLKPLIQELLENRGWKTPTDLAHHTSERVEPEPNDERTERAADPGDYPKASPLDWERLPASYRNCRATIRAALREAGGQTLAEGRAGDFVAYHETFGPRRYPFPDELDAPALLVWHAEGKPIITAVHRFVRRLGTSAPVVRQLKLGHALYLLHLHQR